MMYCYMTGNQNVVCVKIIRLKYGSYTSQSNKKAYRYLNTLRDIFTRIKNLGIEIMLGQKYGDFLKKSPNFVPRIKLVHFHPNLF